MHEQFLSRLLPTVSSVVHLFDKFTILDIFLHALDTA